MVVQTGMKGIAVKSLGGEYVFYPQYDPAEDEKCLALPLGEGSFFLAGISSAADLQADDKTRAAPIQGGIYAVPEDCLKLPFQITAGVTEKTVATGYSETLKKFKFYWDGEGGVYISASSTARSNPTVNDTIIIRSPRGSWQIAQDPTFVTYITTTDKDGGQGRGYVVEEGVNVLEVILKNTYGTTISCPALYLMQDVYP